MFLFIVFLRLVASFTVFAPSAVRFLSIALMFALSVVVVVLSVVMVVLYLR